MKTKAAAAGGIVVLVITILLALDSFMGWNLYGSVMQALDSEAPVIETGSLPSGYQLDSDIILEVTCEDNVDEVCNVEIIGVFDTSVLGNYSVTLQATDEAGNIASYVNPGVDWYDNLLLVVVFNKPSFNVYRLQNK